jgi:hypothetical protein
VITAFPGVPVGVPVVLGTFGPQLVAQVLGVIDALTIAGVVGAAPKTTAELAALNGPVAWVSPLRSLDVAVT